jgi:isopenicillin-N N-acyltransferase-like protein
MSRIVWHVRHAGGWFVTLTEAGIVGKIGLYQSGLGVCVNALRTDRDGIGVATPIHVLLRLLLERSTTLADAEQLLLSTPTSASVAITVVQADDLHVDAATFEITPSGIARRRAEERLSRSFEPLP